MPGVQRFPENLRPQEKEIDMPFPQTRPRRPRSTPAIRRLVAEHRLAAFDLILPAFIREDLPEPAPIGSMPGVVQHTADSVKRAAAQAAEQGLGGIMLFGIPAHRDSAGSAALEPEGVLNAAIRDWVDRRRAVLESLLGIKRAGADMVLTYWASDVATWLKEA